MRRLLLLASVLAAGAGLMIIVLVTTAQAASPPNNELCNACHNQGAVVRLPNGDEFNLAVDPQRYAGSAHGQLDCTVCHQSIKGYPHSANTAYTLKEYKLARQTACARCHAQVYKNVASGVHGGVGITCSDCHSPHYTSPTPSRTDTVGVCSRCHDDSALMEKYGITPTVVQTYLRDFHGKTAALQGKAGHPVEAAVCTDCHGAHEVKPTAALTQADIAVTCQKCHPGTDTKFAAAWIGHATPSLTKSPIIFAVDWMYRLLIPFIVIGLAIHIALDLRRTVKRKGGKHDS